LGFNAFSLIPPDLEIIIANLFNLVYQGNLPTQHQEDKLIWTYSSPGDLSSKDAYIFMG